MVEAENYDLGGEGLAYHDLEIANQGNSYRVDEGVDIEALTAGGFQVGYTEPNEWLEYSVTVATADNYKIECEVASMDGGGSFNFSFTNGASTISTSNITVPATGGWQTMKKVSATINLPIGNYIMRVNIKAKPAFNLNKYTITKVNTSLFPLGDSNNEIHFIISPNPAKSTILISDIIDSPNTDGKIEIFDTNGILQLVYERSVAEKSVKLDVSKLKKGIYIVNIGNSHKKLIIQ